MSDEEEERQPNPVANMKKNKKNKITETTESRPTGRVKTKRLLDEEDQEYW